jgi:hypothetical protein
MCPGWPITPDKCKRIYPFNSNRRWACGRVESEESEL